MDKPYRVLVWAAVSSKPQATDDKASIPSQIQAGHDFAAALDGIVVDVLQVPGHSRNLILWSEAEQMEAYKKLREHTECDDFDILWARSIDRLGRKESLQHQVIDIVEQDDRREVYLADAPHIVGQRGAGTTYQRSMMGASAVIDNRRRRQYHRTGMEARVRRGLHPTTLPYGYRAVRDDRGNVIGAEFHPIEVQALHRMAELLLQGYSYRKIARILTDSPYSPRRSDIWDPSSINRMLRNDSYAGYVSWGDVKSEKSDRFPALWDEATLAAIQAEQQSRAQSQGRRSASLLLRVAFCDHCGKTMWTDIHQALRCSTYSLFQTRRFGPTCRCNYTKIKIITDALTELFRSELDIDTIAAQLTDTNRIPELQSQLDQIERQIADIEQRRTRLALALAADAMDVHVYQSADTELEQQLVAWNGERIEAQKKLDAAPNIEQRRAAFQRIRDNIDTLWTQPPQETNALLRQAGVQVYIENRKIARIVIV